MCIYLQDYIFPKKAKSDYIFFFHPSIMYSGKSAPKEFIDELLELADNDSRVGIQLRPKKVGGIDSSLLKHEWEGSKQFGLNVDNGDTLEPTEVVKKSAESRLKNWKLKKDGASKISTNLKSFLILF